MVVSGKLPTYPCPNLTFCPKKEVSFNVKFIGDEWVGSFPEMTTDLKNQCFMNIEFKQASGVK